MPDLSMRDRILDAAEARARRGGYSAFSFREVGDDVGISSAAVHYHFATKADLAEALTVRYTARVAELLGDPAALSRDEAIERVHSLFRNALIDDDQMCLCGLFGAERDVLPPGVDEAVSRFFNSILEFLRAASTDASGQEEPEMILAKLEGALILARSLRDIGLFERATGQRTFSAAK